MGKSGQRDKPFTIPKQLVREAYRQVRANKGAAGVDHVSMKEFEEDLRGNLECYSKPYLVEKKNNPRVALYASS